MIAPYIQSPAGTGFTHPVPLHRHGCLSEVASQGIKQRRMREGRRLPWRDTHVIDQTMRTAFANAATAISDANSKSDRGCHRLNAMLTVNAETCAAGGETPQDVLRRIMHLLRNFYRSFPQRFAGVWRYEVGTARYGGRHYHIAFHIPRGMRDRLLKAVQRWLDEPIDKGRSSQSFRRSKWQVVGIRSGWHLRRIYCIDGALDYMAKVPKDAAGEAVSRAERLQAGTNRVREFETFGVSKTKPTNEDRLECPKQPIPATSQDVSRRAIRYGARDPRTDARRCFRMAPRFGMRVSNILNGTRPIPFSSARRLAMGSRSIFRR